MWGNKTLMQNANGYTLLSMMLALSAFVIISTVLCKMAVAIFSSSQSTPADRKDIWLFFAQTGSEIASSTNCEVFEGGMSFLLNDQIINYKLIGSTVRRNVDGEGYEIVLQKVSSLIFQCDASIASITIRDDRGRVYKWKIKKMLNASSTD
jgi:competence protein ComGF